MYGSECTPSNSRSKYQYPSFKRLGKATWEECFAPSQVFWILNCKFTVTYHFPNYPSPGSACMKYFGCAKTRACRPVDFSIIILSQHLEPKISQAELCLTNLSRAIAIQPLRNWHPPRIKSDVEIGGKGCCNTSACNWTLGWNQNKQKPDFFGKNEDALPATIFESHHVSNPVVPP